MVTPPAISLRIRAAEINTRARELLARLEEADRLRRRVRALALKALISIQEMETDLRSMSPGERNRYETSCRVARLALKRLSKANI